MLQDIGGNRHSKQEGAGSSSPVEVREFFVQPTGEGAECTHSFLALDFFTEHDDSTDK